MKKIVLLIGLIIFQSCKNSKTSCDAYGDTTTKKNQKTVGR